MKKYFIFIVLFSALSFGQNLDNFKKKFKQSQFPYQAPVEIQNSKEAIDLYYPNTHNQLGTEEVKKFINQEFDNNSEMYLALHVIRIDDKTNAFIVLHLSQKLENGSYAQAYYKMIILQNESPKLTLDIAWNYQQDENPDYGEPASNSRYSGIYHLKGDKIIESPRSFDFILNRANELDSREYSLITFEQVYKKE